MVKHLSKNSYVLLFNSIKAFQLVINYLGCGKEKMLTISY